MYRLMLCLLFLALFAYPSYATEQTNSDNFKILLKETLQKNPDIILDVLKNNCEDVLDMAQEGAKIRRKKFFQTQWQNDIKVPKQYNIENRPILGSKDAKVKIIAYSDFLCSFCQQVASIINPLLKEYGDNIAFVFKHNPLKGRDISNLVSAGV